MDQHLELLFTKELHDPFDFGLELREYGRVDRTPLEPIRHPASQVARDQVVQSDAARGLPRDDVKRGVDHAASHMAGRCGEAGAGYRQVDESGPLRHRLVTDGHNHMHELSPGKDLCAASPADELWCAMRLATLTAAHLAEHLHSKKSVVPDPCSFSHLSTAVQEDTKGGVICIEDANTHPGRDGVPRESSGEDTANATRPARGCGPRILADAWPATRIGLARARGWALAAALQLSDFLERRWCVPRLVPPLHQGKDATVGDLDRGRFAFDWRRVDVQPLTGQPLIYLACKRQARHVREIHFTRKNVQYGTIVGIMAELSSYGTTMMNAFS